MKIKKIILIILGLFCYQHLVRDYLQDKGVKNWYTTFDHWKFILDTPRNNYIGMVCFFIAGSIFFYLAFRKKKYAA
jgi:hypothetical protein